MLSVVILARNERERIKACIESVKFADEIIVVNDNSSDGTPKIAKDCGARVVDGWLPTKGATKYERDDLNKLDFSELRNIGLEQAKGDWILYVDADERVLESLRKEIEEKINGHEVKGAWAISRKNIILGKVVDYGPYKKDWVIRFFKKGDLIEWKGEVHEQPDYKGDLGYLKNPLLHLTHRDLDQIVLKSLDWSNIDADLRFKTNHPKMTSWRFLRIFITESYCQGIKRRGFFNGEVGVIDSMLQVFSLFMSYVRLWQLQQGQSLEEKYRKIDEELMKNDFRC